MTKQRPYDTKRRLSKLLRAVLILGALKIAVFVAMAFNVPIPTISFDFGTRDTAVTGQNLPPAKKAETENRVSGVWKAPVSNIEAKQDLDSIPVAEIREEPQGMAAIEAAKAYSEKRGLNDKLPENQENEKKAAENKPVNPPAVASISALMAPAGVDLSKDPVPASDVVKTAALSQNAKNSGKENAKEDKSGQWWRNILNINRLPAPRFGAEQVAHAASLDMPPAPPVRSNPGGSPFLPPSEQMPVIPNAQDAQGNLLPLRPSKKEDAAPAQNAAPAAAQRQGYSNLNDTLQKQEDLARREQEVLMLKQQMDLRMNDLRSAEKKVEDMLKEAKSAEDAKYKSLINMYRNMKPKQAALALASMDERIAVRILAGMNPKEAGEILSYADPQKTAKLSELITRSHSLR